MTCSSDMEGMLVRDISLWLVTHILSPYLKIRRIYSMLQFRRNDMLFRDCSKRGHKTEDISRVISRMAGQMLSAPGAVQLGKLSASARTSFVVQVNSFKLPILSENTCFCSCKVFVCFPLFVWHSLWSITEPRILKFNFQNNLYVMDVFYLWISFLSRTQFSSTSASFPSPTSKWKLRGQSPCWILVHSKSFQRKSTQGC